MNFAGLARKSARQLFCGMLGKAVIVVQSKQRRIVLDSRAVKQKRQHWHRAGWWGIPATVRGKIATERGIFATLRGTFATERGIFATVLPQLLEIV
ncbi:hypothetical protein [Roseovarius nanhaiticus]|uniref:hypothetical protein n=1 Tax=Roseovarius nanhaiticus TaxID=573024 RepID=UPI002491F4B5|nr:hypothetical protein [Roseovarius nanhaiticus]